MSSYRNRTGCRILGSLTSFPVFRQAFRLGFGRVLLVVGVRNELSGSVVEGVGGDPIGGVIRDGITDPLDMISELALATYPIVFRVQDPFDQVLGVAVDDEWLGAAVRGRRTCWGVRAPIGRHVIPGEFVSCWGGGA